MSDVDYDDLIAEGTYESEFCFLISQEQGPAHAQIALHPRASGEPWEFTLRELQAALQLAADRFWRLRRGD